MEKDQEKSSAILALDKQLNKNPAFKIFIEDKFGEGGDHLIRIMPKEIGKYVNAALNDKKGKYRIVQQGKIDNLVAAVKTFRSVLIDVNNVVEVEKQLNSVQPQKMEGKKQRVASTKGVNAKMARKIANLQKKINASTKKLQKNLKALEGAIADDKLKLTAIEQNVKSDISKADQKIGDRVHNILVELFQTDVVKGKEIPKLLGVIVNVVRKYPDDHLGGLMETLDLKLDSKEDLQVAEGLIKQINEQIEAMSTVALPHSNDFQKWLERAEKAEEVEMEVEAYEDADRILAEVESFHFFEDILKELEDKELEIGGADSEDEKEVIFKKVPVYMEGLGNESDTTSDSSTSSSSKGKRPGWTDDKPSGVNKFGSEEDSEQEKSIGKGFKGGGA